MKSLSAIVLTILLASAPARAQDASPASECGACTELDRQTMAEPAPPVDLVPPAQKKQADRGTPIEFRVPGTGETIIVWHKPGAGLWVSDLAPGGVFVRPKNSKLSVEMKF